MRPVLGVLLAVVAALGCRNQSTTLTNPFLTPDRVPPPSTQLPAPGAAAPYYSGAPLPTVPPLGSPLGAPATIPQVTTGVPTYSPTVAPPASSYPGAMPPATTYPPAAYPPSGYPPATYPSSAPAQAVPPNGWNGFAPQSQVSPQISPWGSVAPQQLAAREVTPAEYMAAPSLPANSAVNATGFATSDGFRPQGSAPAAAAASVDPRSSLDALQFRQGRSGGSDETTTARFARGENYDWLRGQLEYSPETGQWSLRYADAGGPADSFGGRLTIENPQVLGNLPPGEFVKLRGQMYNREQAGGAWAPVYRTASVERQRE